MGARSSLKIRQVQIKPILFLSSIPFYLSDLWILLFFSTKKQLLKRLPDPDRMFKQPIPQTLKAGDLRSRVSRCVVCMRTPHPRMAPLGGGGSGGAEEGSGRPQPQRQRYRG
jgi:hypothetical protein